MSSKNLILKSRHWRYTTISVVLVLPVLTTLVATGAVWIFDVSIAERVLRFLLGQRSAVLAGVWVVLPLLSIYFAHISNKRGTIDRWRPINKATRVIGVISLVAVCGLAVLGYVI
jgi:hypothetical protein